MHHITQEALRALLHRRGKLLGYTEGSGETQSSHDSRRVLSSDELAELGRIESAIDRIRANRYGDCVRCGGPIGLSLLRTIPDAQLCLACSR